MPGHKYGFTEADVIERETAAEDAVRDAAVALVSEVTAGNVIVRDLIPRLDLNSGTDNGWTAVITVDPRWLQSGLTLAGNPNNVYQIDPDNSAKNKAIAFYGITTVKSQPKTTRIKFMKGPEASGMGVKDYIDLEASYNEEQITCLLKDVVLYRPEEIGHIQQIVYADADENIVLLGKVAEKAGDTISLPES